MRTSRRFRTTSNEVVSRYRPLAMAGYPCASSGAPGSRRCRVDVSLAEKGTNGETELPG